MPQKPRGQAPSKTGKPKTPAQQGAANSTSTTTKKRSSDTSAAGDAALKRHRAIAASGAPPPDPDNDPQGGSTEADDEPDDVQPKNPAWAAAMWHLDANTSEAARINAGTQKAYKEIRGLIRELTEYVNHTQILTYGINFHAKDVADRPGCTTLDCNDDVVAEVLWPLWLKYLPELEDHLDYLADNPPLIAIIGAFVTSVASKVRSDDLGRLNDRIIALSNLEDEKQLLVVKDNRGWQDSRTGRLLCPLRYLPRFEEDPGRFCTHVRNRLVRIFSTDYPSFLYDLSLVDQSDAKLGLLRGPVLVNCYKSIMTGKSSVYNASGRAPRGQKSIATEYKIDSVNLYNIVYVALLARSALSDQEWTDVYGKFWKAENVVFSFMEIAFNFPEWHDELIKWWNRQIFGDDNELDSDAERDMLGSAFYTIMAQKDRASTAPDDNDNDNEAPASGSSGVNEGASK